MKCIINGKVILPDRVADNLAVVFDSKIQKLAHINDIDVSEYEVIDAGGKYVSPGLVDMHIHGFLGADVSDGRRHHQKWRNCMVPHHHDSVQSGNRSSF